MEIRKENGKFVLTLNNMIEVAQVLVALEVLGAQVDTVTSLASLPKRSHKKHKKHAFLKTCPKCGKGYRGLKGLGLHNTRVHLGVKWSRSQKKVGVLDRVIGNRPI